MARRKRDDIPTPIFDYKYQDRRKNIPTHELRDFVAEEEKKPQTILYPRDPSLDPQLVWKGKDEQDARPLEVPCVPIYIQEKIRPKAIIEEVRAQAKGERAEGQLDLFNDFNGLTFEQMVDCYHHEQNWSNRLILGDSLLVMTSLAEKKGLKGQVQMIYMDPPYGIKFGSNWQVSTRKREVKDGKIEDLTREPEQIRAYRDTWKLGIHSYLSYLRDRLVVPRELLTETGSIFVQIGDENVHLVRCMMDEVFGVENFVVEIILKKTPSHEGKLLESINDYVLWYAKSKLSVKFNPLFEQWSLTNLESTKFSKIIFKDGKIKNLTLKEKKDLKIIEGDYQLFRDDVALSSEGGTEDDQVPFFFQGKKFYPGIGRHWRTGRDISKLSVLAKAGRISAGTNRVFFRLFFDDFSFSRRLNIWEDITGAQNKIYVVQTNQTAIERCLLMTTDPGDLVLDPTCVRKGTKVLTPLNPSVNGGKFEGMPVSGGRGTPPDPPASGGGSSLPAGGEGWGGVFFSPASHRKLTTRGLGPGP